MNTQSKPYIASNLFIRLTMTMLTLLLISSTSFAHGPKGHSNVDFTSMKAVQKGLTLYDRLIDSGKLEEAWETGLKNVEVFQKQKEERIDFIVKFSRSKGEPRSVYIFFNEKGDYTGSNFTGN